jgi:hypothetical protein
MHGSGPAPRGRQYRALNLRRREVLGFKEFSRECQDFSFGGLIHGFDTHDTRRKQWRVIADEAGKFVLGRAVTDNQNLMRRLQGAHHRCQIGLAVVGVPGANRPSLMVDIALPIRRLDPVFGHIGFGELEDRGFCVIYRDDGMEMAAFALLFALGRSISRRHVKCATSRSNGDHKAKWQLHDRRYQRQLTVRRSSTCVTPGADQAVRSATLRS